MTSFITIKGLDLLSLTRYCFRTPPIDVAVADYLLVQSIPSFYYCLKFNTTHFN